MSLWLSKLRRRVRALFHGDSLDRELADEMRAHIASEAADLMQREGISAEEAERRARVAFGGVQRYREEHRDARGVLWLEHRAQDIRYAARGLRNRPAFTAAVVLTLALGIGANAAMFSIVDRLLFRAPPLMHAAALTHRVTLSSMWRGKEEHHSYLPYARFVDLTRDTHTFARTALFSEQQVAIGLDAEAREVQVGIVTSGFFGFFDAPAIVGRYFTTAEDTPPSGTAVAVLSYGLWQTQFGGRADVAGQPLQVGPARYTIIGVAPKGFAGLWPETPPAVYVPAAAFAGERRSAVQGEPWWKTYHWTWAQMMVQRKPGITPAQADADLSQANAQSYLRELAASPHEQSITLQRPRGSVTSILSDRGPNESSLAKVATWIGGVALIVWLIACANVANLLLARALQRRREIAVRLALGVTRGRLTAQLLTESILLALLGGAAGLAIAQWGGTALRAAFLSPTSTASVLTDSRTLLYAGVAALAAGVLAGLAPLLQARHASLGHDLRGGARAGTYRRSRLRSALLVMQGTLSVILLIGAGLFVRSLRHVKAAPLGFQADQVLYIDANMRGVTLDSAHAQALVERMRATVLTVPGVTNATRQITVPFMNTWNQDLHVAGIDSVNVLGSFNIDAVSPEYFATMGTHILQGRGISAQDVANAPQVMVVSQAMAQKLWPAQSPIDKCVRIGSDTMPCHYVVGVAENIKNDDLGEDPGLFYYLSALQFHPQQGGLFVRVGGNPDVAKEGVRRALQKIMPGAAYVTVTPLRDVIGEQTQPWRLGAALFVVFGLLALTLATIGLYSVVAFNVGQRMHELGVRVALGATMGHVVRQVVAGGLQLVVVGVVLGAGSAFLLGRYIKPLLFEESATDPTVFALVAVVLLAVATVASLVPARRAAHVDPIRALRAE